MIIWIMLLVLVGGLAALGRQIGSIRMGVSMIGAIVSYVGTLYLTPIVAPMMDTAGIRHPVTVFWLTPIVVFLVLFVFMNGIAQGAYMKINLYFQYRAKEDAKMRFERMDTNVGLALGIANGCVLLCIITVPIYVAGYITLQFKSDNDPFLYSMLNKARADLSASGFDKIAASLAPDNSELFMKADTVAMIYHNPSVQEFLAEYPQFYTLTENATILGKPGPDDGSEEEMTDKDGNPVPDFGGLITGKEGMGKILAHPKGIKLVDDSDFMYLVEDIDFGDLNNFIKTGESQRYGEEKLVGKWEINLNRSFRDFGQKYPKQIRGSYLARMPGYAQRFKDIELTLAPDGAAYLKTAAGGMVNYYALYNLIQQRYPAPQPARGAKKTIATGTWGPKGEDGFTLNLTGKNIKVQGDGSLKGGFLNWVNLNNNVQNPVVMHRIR